MAGLLDFLNKVSTGATDVAFPVMNVLSAGTLGLGLRLQQQQAAAKAAQQGLVTGTDSLGNPLMIDKNTGTAVPVQILRGGGAVGGGAQPSNAGVDPAASAPTPAPTTDKTQSPASPQENIERIDTIIDHITQNLPNAQNRQEQDMYKQQIENLQKRREDEAKKLNPLSGEGARTISLATMVGDFASELPTLFFDKSGKLNKGLFSQIKSGVALTADAKAAMDNLTAGKQALTTFLTGASATPQQIEAYTAMLEPQAFDDDKTYAHRMNILNKIVGNMTNLTGADALLGGDSSGMTGGNSSGDARSAVPEIAITPEAATLDDLSLEELMALRKQAGGK